MTKKQAIQEYDGITNNILSTTKDNIGLREYVFSSIVAPRYLQDMKKDEIMKNLENIKKVSEYVTSKCN